MPVFETDPATMTPKQRFQEVAAILARGILRLRAAIPTIPESASESGQKSLDLPPQTSPDGQCG
jgi:hypothetical protein